jgi:hypothetical protein
MKNLLFLATILILASCSHDDCDGKASEINKKYDLLISQEMNGAGVPDYDYIDTLEEQRINELGRACDQTDVLPLPEIPQP